MISNANKSKFMRIIKDLKPRRAKNYTQKELAELLEVSLKKLNDFENGRNFDFWLLTQYSAILGKKVMFEMI